MIIFSCRKNRLTHDASAKLEFNTDTVLFDTVWTRFTGQNPASVTKTFVVYNRNSSDVEADIFLAGGPQSVFRVNIDGNASSNLSKYRIPAKDSIFIFVQVTPNQNSQNLPLIVDDSLIFITNGNTQKIHLVAWGQDAWYLDSKELTMDTTLSDTQKPYVIYNYLYVPENMKLTIGKGVKIYSHVNAAIYIQGTLIINGTAAEPVVLQGDRLDKSTTLGLDFTKDVYGQWYGIRILPRSKDNEINFAIIKNGTVGIEVDSLPMNGKPNLLIRHTKVQTMTYFAIAAFSATIRAENCLFANCGNVAYYGQFGGNHTLYNCTFTGYKNMFSSTQASLYLSNADYVVKDNAGNVILQIPSPLKMELVNDIMYGNNDNELVINSGGSAAVTAVIDNNSIKTKSTGFPGSNQINMDPKFKDVSKFDFSLDTLSPAINAGSTLLFGIITDDILGKPRDATPCIGAYERN